MLTQRFVGQPGTGSSVARNADAVVELVATRGVSKFDAAIAYVTDGGVTALVDAIESAGVNHAWKALKKRYLAGIDWFRTDPTALDRLAAMPGAAVRVHDGARVVARRGCIPHVPWHPKFFGVSGSSVGGALCGSGNLSRNGMLGGHEVGLLQVVRSPSNNSERLAAEQLRVSTDWFDLNWQAGTPLDQVIVDYKRAFARNPQSNPSRNDDTSDDSASGGRRRGLTPEQLAALMTARHFWIEAGLLSRNRGPTRPGDQLMMSAMMRVFFGGMPVNVAQNTAVGRAIIEHPDDQGRQVDAPIRFSDNSMDVITLPLPQAPWPSSYDGMTLLFEKVARGTSLHYVLRVRTLSGARGWRRSSANQGTTYAMQGGRGRRWGVFS